MPRDDRPSGYTVQQVMALAMSTLDRLRHEDGLVLDTDAEITAALADEGVAVEALLQRMGRAALDAKAMAEALDKRVADMRARRDRLARAEEAWRGALFAALDALGMATFRDPEFTASVAAGRPAVVVTDPGALPDELVRIKREPDKAAILALMKAGETVPGAEMSNTPQTITLRTR